MTTLQQDLKTMEENLLDGSTQRTTIRNARLKLEGYEALFIELDDWIESIHVIDEIQDALHDADEEE